MGSCCTTQLKVIRCSRCLEDSKFHCLTCDTDICVRCKEKHVIHLDTKHHDVVIGSLKYRDSLIPESCKRHPDRYYGYWCKSCQRPVCTKCNDHRNHEKIDLVKTFRTCIQQHRERIIRIRSEILPYNSALLAQIKSDLKSLNTKIDNLKLEMNFKVQRMKEQIDICTVLKEISGSNLYFESQLQQRRNVTYIHKHIQRYELLENRPVQFLFLLKKITVPKIKVIPGTLALSLTEEINMEDVAALLGKLQIKETGRKVGNEDLLKMMSTAVLQKSFTVTDVRGGVSHISCVMPDRAWVNDNNNLILTNTTGESLSLLTDISSPYGIHTVTRHGDLMYIDRNSNLIQLSAKNKAMTSLREQKESWTPRCVFCSPSNGDFLVGAIWYDKSEQRYTEANITRYSSKGQQLQIIQHNNKGENLYSDPIYITENRNGDVIVSDMFRRTVVVTDCEGEYRFSYRGSPSNSGFFVPNGICTDALSNILVCDGHSKTVQMIDKDGCFLSLLLTEQNGINRPGGLCYDDKTHLLWVGSWWDNTVCVYRYIQSKDFLISSFD
ncbi:uncharacterized protein LOC133174786 [Saccostrea echinata]|uniref:uncharacterized protein LOC133174786 n=1 Tax=Saccostrea echinata TaxID=191078 RepID=UPI002A824B11|nr:uncharacterized protein LOC133174786 [Saccostrea echinata]